MKFTDISQYTSEARRYAHTAGIVALVMVVLMLLIRLPFTEKTEEEKLEEELGGVTVALGWPDMGSNNDTPVDGGGEAPTPDVPSDPTPTPPTPSPAPNNPPAPVVTGEDPDVKYAREKAREAEKQRLKEIDESIKKSKAEADAKETVRRAEEARERAAAEAEAKRQADIKSKIGGIGLGKKPGSQGGTGTGSGSGSGGNGGRPDGSPDSDRLNGGGSGNGSGVGIGNGLRSRGYKGSSPLPQSFNESGVVVVKVCVDASGKVTSQSIALQGTTTSSSTLRNLALNNARTYRFGEGESETCGNITYTFKVK